MAKFLAHLSVLALAAGFAAAQPGPAGFLSDRLKLTAEQKKQFEEITKEMHAKLEKILTDEQKKTFEKMHKAHEGFGRFGKGPDAWKGRFEDRGPGRPAMGGGRGGAAQPAIVINIYNTPSGPVVRTGPPGGPPFGPGGMPERKDGRKKDGKQTDE